MSAIDPERYRREKALFFAALDQPEAIRADWISRQDVDPDLARVVLERLRRDLAQGCTFERGLQHGVRTALDAAAPPMPPAIGPYRLIEKIGEGGMGSVWLAEKDGPVTLRVALKLIKPGMDCAAIVSRFEPIPSICAPMLTSILHRSCTCGSLATFRKIVVPCASILC